GSDRDEITWVSDILGASNCSMLLDLHNLYANGLNFGYDPMKALNELPMDRIAAVHLAGGKWIGPGDSRRMLDDHLHDVPHPVYDLLVEVGARAPRPITVILERDGQYPPIEVLLDQLDQARTSLARGRARQLSPINQEAA